MSLLPKNNNRLPRRKKEEDARQYAYRILKKSIMELVLLPTQKLNELELSNTLSLSRTPVHDTITKLSRDRLVELVPKKGAYVAGFDAELFKHSIWLQSTFGATVIQNILARELQDDEIQAIHKRLDDLKLCITENRLNEVTSHIIGFYEQLYLLSGHMDLIWNTLKKSFSDYQRILFLATSTSSTISHELFMDLSNLTNFMITRQSDQAYLIFDQHLSKVLLLLEPIKKYKPDYLIG